MKKNLVFVTVFIIFCLGLFGCTQQTATTTCSQIGDSRTSFGELSASKGFKIEATPILSCTIPSAEKIVSFRQSSNWLAIDTNGDGKVDSCYSYTGSQISECLGTQIATTSSGSKVTLYNSKIILCDGTYRTYSLVAASNCEMSITPVSGYQEVYYGTTNIYSCSGIVKVDGVQKETITYSSENAGTKRGSTVILAPDQSPYYTKIEFPGNIEYKLYSCTSQELGTCQSGTETYYVGDKICGSTSTLLTCTLDSGTGKGYWVTTNIASPRICSNGQIVCPSGCTENKCSQDKTGFFQCLKDSLGCYFIAAEMTPCGQNTICENGVCKTPYTATLQPGKDVYSMSEQITGTVKLSGTSQNKNIVIDINLKNADGNLVDSRHPATDSIGSAPFTFSAVKSSGNYVIEAIVNHPLGTIKISHQIRIAQSMTVILNPDSLVQQYNREITTFASFQDETGTKKNVKEWILSATMNGVPVNTRYERLGTGEYVFYSTVSTVGDYELSATAVSYDDLQVKGETARISVESPTIIISAKLPENEKVGTHPVSFTTKNPQGETITASCIVYFWDASDVDESQVAKVTASNNVANYNFAESGQNYVDIRCSDPSGKLDASRTGKLPVNIVGEGGTEEDTTSKIIIIVVIVVALLGVFVYLIIRRRR